MNIDVGVKTHNRFDIEVKDITTGEIKWYEAENIVLNSMFDYLCTSSGNNTKSIINNYIKFGRGTGELSKTRTTLFNYIGDLKTTTVEVVANISPTSSYKKTKIIIAPELYVGETITEVGIHSSSGTSIFTHALITDSEKNEISIGPKTDTQEITIYSTVYGTVSLPSNCQLLIPNPNNNLLLSALIGTEDSYLVSTFWNGLVAPQLKVSTSKISTNPLTDHNSEIISNVSANFTILDSSKKTIKTPRIRFGAALGNGKIWSVLFTSIGGNANYGTFMRILFPNTLWPGYHFEGKNIGTGNGITTKFILPWSDINTSKQYDFYIDGAKKTVDTDYTLANAENETSITFVTAPASGVITGDWWVDYIPKDTDHVLDITFTITFGEGV